MGTKWNNFRDKWNKARGQPNWISVSNSRQKPITAIIVADVADDTSFANATLIKSVLKELRVTVTEEDIKRLLSSVDEKSPRMAIEKAEMNMQTAAPLRVFVIERTNQEFPTSSVITGICRESCDYG